MATRKAIDEFFEVQLPSGASAPVVCPVNKGFGESNDRIDPVKDNRRLRIVAQGDFMIGLMSTSSRRIDGRTIAAPYTLVFHAAIEDIQDGVFLQVRHRVHENMTGVPLAIQAHAHDDRILVGTTPPFPRSMAHAAEIRIIQFHESPQLVAGIAVLHRLLETSLTHPEMYVTKSYSPSLVYSVGSFIQLL